MVISSAYALSGPPTIPVTYIGNLISNEEIVQGDFEVSAFIGENIMSLGEASGGSYEIDVSSCCGVGSGDISFFVNGIEANEHPAYNGEADYGKVVELDLTFNEEIPETSLCGNEEVNPGEQCDGTNINFATCTNVIGTGWTGTVSCAGSCAFDVSDCSYSGTGPSSSSGSSSSSSSGSGSSSSSSGGFTEDTSILTKSKQTESKANTNINLINSDGKPNFGITGAVTGLLSSSGGIALMFVIIVLVLGVVVIIIQKAQRNPNSTSPQTL